MTLWTQVQDDLDRIEAALQTHLDSDVGPARALCEHLLFNPGKRIRPLLAVLSTRLGGDESQSLTLAAAVEYLHAATLLHDDILDDAQLRRGKTAAHHIWGNAFTILGGDFLLARAILLVAGLNNGHVIQKFAYFAEKIIAGEIREISLKGNPALDETGYLEIIQGKTAFLFQAACESGAHLGGLQPQQIVVLGEYGRNLGLAFQIEDDIMDYRGESKQQGKLKGNDLREGKATLPLILALQKANTAEIKMVADIFAAGDATVEQFNRVYDFISDRNGFSDAHYQAQKYIDAATTALDVLPVSKTKTIMTELAAYVISVNTKRN